MLKANEALGLSNSADVRLFENKRDIFDYFFQKIETKIRKQCSYGRRRCKIDEYDVYEETSIRHMPHEIRSHILEIVKKELLNNGYKISSSSYDAGFEISW